MQNVKNDKKMTYKGEKKWQTQRKITSATLHSVKSAKMKLTENGVCQYCYILFDKLQKDCKNLKDLQL